MLVVTGAVDHEHWDTFRGAIVGAARPWGTKAVVIDLARVHFFDSGGIRALASARKALDERGIALHVDGASPQVQRLFEMTGLDAYVPPFPT